MMTRTTIAALGAGLILAGTAQAQTLGNYSGTQANGAGISLTLTTDATTGLPEITSFGIGLQGNCKPTGTVNTGWGFNPNVDVKNNKASFTYSFDYLWTKITVVFSGGAVSGTSASVTSILAPAAKGAPTRGWFCKVPKQSYTMNYTGPASAALRGVTYYGRPQR